MCFFTELGWDEKLVRSICYNFISTVILVAQFMKRYILGMLQGLVVLGG
jgi:hypothetical protein